MSREGGTVSGGNYEILVRFHMNAAEWVPHPYMPPIWTLYDFDSFSRYIVGNESAFQLCNRWKEENHAELTRRVANRLRTFPVKVAASYFCYEQTDYADVAFLVPTGRRELLHVKSVWKGESALADLVIRIFPDAKREYAPSWLNGQRIDVFIPSLNVGIEYHGEQHYRPVDYFGGKKGHKETIERDRRKARLCKDAGVVLLEWKYTEPISEEALRRKLERRGYSK